MHFLLAEPAAVAARINATTKSNLMTSERLHLAEDMFENNVSATERDGERVKKRKSNKITS